MTLFDLKPPKKHRSHPPQLQIVFDAFERAFGRPMQVASFAETTKQAKRLAELVPDEDLRVAFLAAYYRTSDPFLRERDYPLRLALVDGRFPKLLRQAERWVAARRRKIALAYTSLPITAASPATIHRLKFIARILGVGECVLLEREISAGSIEQAQMVADAWYRAVAPSSALRVDVVPVGGTDAGAC
jgi:hypothetical protein